MNFLIVCCIVLAMEEEPESMGDLIELSIQYGGSFSLSKEQVEKVLSLSLVDILNERLNQKSMIALKFTL